MTFKHNKLIITLLILVLVQCKKQTDTDKYTPPVFTEKKEVVTKRLNDSFIFDTGRIDVIDTFIVSSGKTDINIDLFHLFSKTTGEYIRSFGQMGQGPGEITLPVSGFSTDQEQNKIYFFDSGQLKLTEFYLDYIDDEIAVSAKDNIMPPEINNVLAEMFYSLGNNEFISANNSSFGTNYRFIKTNLDDTISTYNQYPKLNEPEEFINVEHSYFSYMGRLAVKPDGEKFVYATRGGCILEIFDCSDNIKPLHTKRFFEPTYLPPKRKDVPSPFVKWDPNSITGIVDMFCTDKYIYTIYSDRKDEEKFNQIAVFDWDGNPVKLLSFENSIFSFTIENNDEKGYALMRDPVHDVYMVSFDL